MNLFKSLLLSFLLTSNVYAKNLNDNISTNLIIKLSQNSVSETIDKLEKILKSKGITVFLRLDHAQGAHKVGNNLRPTQLLIFGNPKLGSPLMMQQQSIAIDLPLKVSVWEDEAGKVWLAYNNPKNMAVRHQVKTNHPVIIKMTQVLNKLTNHAVSK